MKKALLILTILLTIRTSFAVSIENVSIPSKVWYGEGFLISWRCLGVNVTSVLSIHASTVQGPLDTKPEIKVEGDEFSWSPTTPTLFPTGKYEVNITCFNQTSRVEYEDTFIIRDVLLEVNEITGQYGSYVYTDDVLSLDVSVKEITDTEVEVKSGVEWRIFLNGKELNKDWIYTSSWKITSNLEDEGVEEGMYKLRLEAVYEGRVFSYTTDVEVKPPLEVEITHLAPTQVHGKENITLRIDAKYHGRDVVGDEELSIEVKVDGTGIDYSMDQSTITFVAPTLPLGKHELELRASYYSTTVSVKRDLDYVALLSGSIYTPDNKAVNGLLSINGRVYRISGSYNVRITPGKYDMKFSFPMSTITFHDVEISGDTSDFIRYEENPGIKIEGLKIASVVVVEFALNYSSVDVQIRYDDSKVLDETGLQVYACHNWNFGARACVGDWTQVDAEFDTVRNVAKFELEELSAFVVGEREKLEVEASLDKSEYFLGEKMELTGVVRTERGFKVSNAKISYEIPGTRVSGEEETNENGAFVITLNAPNKEGSFKLIIKATRSSFKTSTLELEFSTYKKRELSLVTPDSVTVWSNENSTVEVSLVNTGQEKLRDVRISVSGLPNDWLDFLPKEIKEIKPNEERVIRINVFPRNPTMDSYLITVKAVSGEISTTSEFTIVPREKREVKEEKKPLTGFFYLPRVNPRAVYIGLPILILLLILLYYKKKWSKIFKAKEGLRDELEKVRSKLTS